MDATEASQRLSSLDGKVAGMIPPERLEQYRAALSSGPSSQLLESTQNALLANQASVQSLRSRLDAPEVKAALEANRSRLLLMNATTAGSAVAQPAQPVGGDSQTRHQQTSSSQPADQQTPTDLPLAEGIKFRNPVFGEVRRLSSKQIRARVGPKCVK